MKTILDFREYLSGHDGSVSESMKLVEYTEFLKCKNNWNDIFYEMFKYHGKKDYLNNNRVTKLGNISNEIHRLVGAEFLIEYIKFRKLPIEILDDLEGFIKYFQDDLNPDYWNAFPKSAKNALITWTLNRAVDKIDITRLLNEIQSIKGHPIHELNEVKNLLNKKENKFLLYNVRPYAYLFREMLLKSNDVEFLKIYDIVLSNYK